MALVLGAWGALRSQASPSAHACHGDVDTDALPDYSAFEAYQIAALVASEIVLLCRLLLTLPCSRCDDWLYDMQRLHKAVCDPLLRALGRARTRPPSQAGTIFGESSRHSSSSMRAQKRSISKACGRLLDVLGLLLGSFLALYACTSRYASFHSAFGGSGLDCDAHAGVGDAADADAVVALALATLYAAVCHVEQRLWRLLGWAHLIPSMYLLMRLGYPPACADDDGEGHGVIAACLYVLLLLGFIARRSAAFEMRLMFLIAVQAAAETAFQTAKREQLETRLAQVSQAYEIARSLFARFSEDQTPDEDEKEATVPAPPTISIRNEIRGLPKEVFSFAVCKPLNWDKAMRAARECRNPDYLPQEFLSDVIEAFPELSLYTVQSAETEIGTTDVSSGVSAADEYRRTIGALFALYWLVRIGIDGERGFCFGVDGSMRVREPPDLNAEESKDDADLAKRTLFYEKQDWAQLLQLMIDAQVLRRTPSGDVEVDETRLVAMLALTAIHDICKVEALLPRVEEQHAPYSGFNAGDIINDHDIALGYILNYHGGVLPSFAALPEEQQRSVRFTQSKMCFNHGWLVQAEAPPGALFSRFKQIILSEGVEQADISFYFVHWLTDLAGAEPTPLRGAEKLVLKFPHEVLASFIRSFSVLNELAQRTETQVFEEYLVSQWAEIKLGPLPIGNDAIAIMRLVVQAQSIEKQVALIDAFAEITPEDKRVLSFEMARTGCVDQFYSRAQMLKVGGPAMLIYYSPAFLRNLAPARARYALRLLAEVYRRARVLWPLRASDAGKSVTVRIDQIKGLQLDAIQAAYTDGHYWLLSKRNELEAVVERHPLEYMDELKDKGVKVTVLKFWRANKEMDVLPGVDRPIVFTSQEVSARSTCSSFTSAPSMRTARSGASNSKMELRTRFFLSTPDSNPGSQRDSPVQRGKYFDERPRRSLSSKSEVSPPPRRHDSYSHAHSHSNPHSQPQSQSRNDSRRLTDSRRDDTKNLELPKLPLGSSCGPDRSTAG